MYLRVLQIIIVLMLTVSCAQNNKLDKTNVASNLADESMKVLLSYPKKYLQQNPQLCKTIPAKYAQAEQQLKKIKDNDSYKFQAGIITGIYRFTALRTNCSTDFLNKNPSVFDLDGKRKNSEYNGPGVFYFMQGELFGFLAEGFRLEDPQLEYTEAVSLVLANQLMMSSAIGGDAEISAKLMKLTGSLKEKGSFTDYGLPLK